MPMYQYACDTCGLDFERAQSFHDDPLSECPECGGAVRRVIAPVGIIFKGSGWYITDSRRQIATTARKGHKGEDNGKETAAETATKEKEPAGTSAGDAASSGGNGAGGGDGSSDRGSSDGQSSGRSSTGKSAEASTEGAKAGA